MLGSTLCSKSIVSLGTIHSKPSPGPQHGCSSFPMALWLVKRKSWCTAAAVLPVCIRLLSESVHFELLSTLQRSSPQCLFSLFNQAMLWLHIYCHNTLGLDIRADTLAHSPFAAPSVHASHEPAHQQLQSASKVAPGGRITSNSTVKLYKSCGT